VKIEVVGVLTMTRRQAVRDGENFEGARGGGVIKKKTKT